MVERSARDVVEELVRRQAANDMTVLDDVVAEDMVNHAAGPQGRDGLRQIFRSSDLGPITFSSITSSHASLSACTVHTHPRRCRSSTACRYWGGRRRGGSSTFGGSPMGSSWSTGRAATTWVWSNS